MFKGQIISDLIDKRRAKKVDVYTYAGITKATLDNIIKGISIPNCTTIEKIADFFDVSIDEFFEREKPHLNIGHTVNGNGNNVSGDIQLHECQKEIEHLKELLNEKERLIQVLMKR
ncbi:helix-turn-helix domain-containing protein [Phocaeicola sp. HCN-6420]|jgi:transcriptional regulator with XRE-family HTH domain|uniref:helix-turn-helix domain-containing protein n=1 Tax=Phocaeicola sp. HCN-6420 TaxID=3134673 RepID=UPI0030C2B7AA